MYLALARQPARSAAETAATESAFKPLSILRKWLNRRHQRKALRELAEGDEHLLRDIGLSRAEALREAAKPFWQA